MYYYKLSVVQVGEIVLKRDYDRSVIVKTRKYMKKRRCMYKIKFDYSLYLFSLFSLSFSLLLFLYFLLLLFLAFLLAFFLFYFLL